MVNEDGPKPKKGSFSDTKPRKLSILSALHPYNTEGAPKEDMDPEEKIEETDTEGDKEE